LTLAIYGTGALAWIGYGINTHDVPLIVSSILALVPTGITLVYVWRVTRQRLFPVHQIGSLQKHLPAA
jgi:hypothetical protein